MPIWGVGQMRCYVSVSVVMTMGTGDDKNTRNERIRIPSFQKIKNYPNRFSRFFCGAILVLHFLENILKIPGS